MALDTVETPSGRMENSLGGAAVYFSMAARHFAAVRMVATVGNDFPDQHVEMLKNAGIAAKSSEILLTKDQTKIITTILSSTKTKRKHKQRTKVKAP